jgi:hypothetical protein
MAYGAQILNKGGKLICDGANPSIIVKTDPKSGVASWGPMPPTVMAQWPRNAYIDWCWLAQNGSDIPLVPGDGNFVFSRATYPVSFMGVVNGKYRLCQYNNATATSVAIGTKSSIPNQVSGNYGLQIFNAAGQVVLDSRGKPVSAIDVLAIEESTLINLLAAGKYGNFTGTDADSLLVTHTTCPGIPVYSMSGSTVKALVYKYKYGWAYPPYATYAGELQAVMGLAVKAVSKSSCRIGWICEYSMENSSSTTGYYDAENFAMVIDSINQVTDGSVVVSTPMSGVSPEIRIELVRPIIPGSSVAANIIVASF